MKLFTFVFLFALQVRKVWCSVAIRTPHTNVCEDDARNQCTVHPIETFSTVKHENKAFVLEWHGIPASPIEHKSVQNLRTLALHNEPTEWNSSWLASVTDIELLRFLRAKHGHEEEALKMLSEHVHWRNSTYGADSPFMQTFFDKSPLHHEVFWMGLNKEGCPTLVVRSQIHDGVYYNEDPHLFTRYVSTNYTLIPM